MLILRPVGLVFAALGIAFGCGGATSGGPSDGGMLSSSTGAGGFTGTGGTGGSGGSGGQPPCTAGTTAFHMAAENGNDPAWCVGLQCTPGWMTITSLGGTAMPITLPCETNCSDCIAIGCPAICIAPQPMQSGGERLTWDGTFWEASTCGAGAACRRKTCAAPGRYKAKMCAASRTSDAGPFCMPNATPTCVELEFDYPSSTTVEGLLD